MKDKLEKIVATILGVPKRDVDSVCEKSKNGHAQVEFFVTKPSSETQELCDSGRMPPKILRALERDDDVASIHDKQKSKNSLY